MGRDGAPDPIGLDDAGQLAGERAMGEVRPVEPEAEPVGARRFDRFESIEVVAPELEAPDDRAELEAGDPADSLSRAAARSVRPAR